MRIWADAFLLAVLQAPSLPSRPASEGSAREAKKAGEVHWLAHDPLRFDGLCALPPAIRNIGRPSRRSLQLTIRIHPDVLARRVVAGMIHRHDLKRFTPAISVRAWAWIRVRVCACACVCVYVRVCVRVCARFSGK